MKTQNSNKTNANNSNNVNHFNQVLAIQGMNALENALRKQGVRTQRANVPLHKAQAFYESCGKNLLPLKQIPELIADGYRYGLLVRLDSANRPYFKMCVGLAGDPTKYTQVSFENTSTATWIARSTWFQPELNREERGILADKMAEAYTVLADRYDTMDIGIDETGKLAFAKTK